MLRNARSVLPLVLVAVLVVLGVSQTSVLQRWLARDYLQYWAAGRLNLRGENPYDPALVLAEEQIVVPERKTPLMMWNPPPALALYMPLAVLPIGWGNLIWICLQLYTVILATKLLWRVYAPAHPQWLLPIVAASWVWTWWLMLYGQNTGFILLGLSGYLYFMKKEKPFAAGACAAVTALKPHLLAVFGVLLIVDAISRRGRAAIASGVAVIFVALVIALVTNPAVLAQYLESARNPVGTIPLSAYILPAPAYWLRMWIAPEQFWIQFVPCAVACAAFLAYRLWKAETWDWARMLPLVVAVSVLTTPYSGWIFDLSVLLVPIAWATAESSALSSWHLPVHSYSGKPLSHSAHLRLQLSCRSTGGSLLPRYCCVCLLSE